MLLVALLPQQGKPIRNIGSALTRVPFCEISTKITTAPEGSCAPRLCVSIKVTKV